MSHPTNILEDIRDIFSILHDGKTDTWTGDKQNLTLKVTCEYLASLIDTSYKSFFIELCEINELELNKWTDPKETSTNIHDIFLASLTILSTIIEDDHVRIRCNQSNPEYNYCGGELLLNCKRIKVYDEGQRELTIEGLDAICKEYWKKVSDETEQRILKSWEEKSIPSKSNFSEKEIRSANKDLIKEAERDHFIHHQK